MAEQLYNVHAYHLNGDPKISQFIMSAPMVTLRAVLSLHDSAVRRIEHETADGGSCDLHSAPWKPPIIMGYQSVVVTKADPK